MKMEFVPKVATSGVTRASVNKQLGWFEERGILTADREGILIRKPDQLRKRVY